MNFTMMFKRDNDIENVKLIKKAVDFQLSELIRRQKEFDSNLFQVTAFMLENVSDAMSAIITLRKEHFKSSLIIARNILEDSVNLQYIYNGDSERKALNHIVFSQKEYLKRTYEYKDQMPNDLKEKIFKNQDRITSYSPSGARNNYWDGLSIKEIMESLGYRRMYSDWYVRLSSYIHSQYKNKIDINSDGPYITFLRELLFKDLLVNILQSLKSINERLNLTEGGAIFKNYPKKGNTLVFSIDKSDGKSYTNNEEWYNKSRKK